MANSRRYNGLTRAQQQRRNASRFRQMVANGQSSTAWNTMNGRAAVGATRGGVSAPTFFYKSQQQAANRAGLALEGWGNQAGYASYGDQGANARTRQSYRNVRAAFGLSAG